MHSRPKALIFDAGGVFLKFLDGFSVGHKFLAKCKIKEGEAVDFLLNSAVMKDYETNVISSGDFYKTIVKEYGYPDDYETFKKDFCGNIELDEEMFSFLQKLRCKYGGEIYFWMLSNINEIHYQYLRYRYPGLFSSFEKVFLSFEMGLRKPDLRIYEKVAKIGGVEAWRCLFIDDRAENCEGAKKARMNSILFEGLEKLKKSLIDFIIEV